MKVEYTDAPVVQSEPTTGDKMPCPFCGHLLPKDAERCDRCDWVRGATQTAEGKASDAVAVMFSIVPGLGHIYKGHILAGLLWMLGAIPVGIFVFLAAFASAGWGLGLFFFYLAAAMLHAYGIDDRVVPPKEDEGEEYRSVHSIRRFLHPDLPDRFSNQKPGSPGILSRRVTQCAPTICVNLRNLWITYSVSAA